MCLSSSRPLFAAILVATALFTGCATPYVEPTDPSSATLRLQYRSTNHAVTFSTYEAGETCQASTVRKIASNADGMFKMKLEGGVDIRIKPGVPFTLNASAQGPSSACGVLATFLPQKNTTYRAAFSVNTNRCHLSIERAVGDGLAVRYVPEESARQRYARAGLLHGGSSCE